MEIYPRKRAKTCMKEVGERKPHPVFISLMHGVAVTRPGLGNNPQLTQFDW